MLRPSYTDLLEVITKNAEDITIASRYTIVIAAAKRARQLVDHAEMLVSDTKVNKPVSIAVNELYQGKIKVRQGYTEELQTEQVQADTEEAAAQASEATEG